ncbi:MAG: GGDEF domain-containing protein [Octadecabacter sp.]|nr:GGDEF domain-containing protein [Octadecabacter sp.]
MILVLGGFNFLRDVIDYGSNHDGYFNNLYEAAFVGAPFVLLALALIGHMQRLQMKLVHLATTDMLTGLPNRRAFLEVANGGSSDRDSDILMMIDVDHFKRINDTYGHAIGDLCLQKLALCFRKQIREEDIVARMGGEEFAVLLQGASLDEALSIANRIATGGRINFGVEDTEVMITTSVGLAMRAANDPIDVVLHKADHALYLAKADGRACARISSDLSRTASISRMTAQ